MIITPFISIVGAHLVENIGIAWICDSSMLGKDPNVLPNACSGQITIIPKPELRGFWGDSLTFHHHLG